MNNIINFNIDLQYDFTSKRFKFVVSHRLEIIFDDDNNPITAHHDTVGSGETLETALKNLIDNMNLIISTYSTYKKIIHVR